MDLGEIRQEIDKIDDALIKLFCARMELSAQVADYKKANNLPIFVPAREQAILDSIAEKAGSELSDYAQTLYRTIFEVSRNYQQHRNEVNP